MVLVANTAQPAASILHGGYSILYPYDINPRPLKHIMWDIPRRLLLRRHHSRMQRNLGISACCFTLGQLARVDHHHTVDDLHSVSVGLT